MNVIIKKKTEREIHKWWYVDSNNKTANYNQKANEVTSKEILCWVRREKTQRD